MPSLVSIRYRWNNDIRNEYYSLVVITAGMSEFDALRVLEIDDDEIIYYQNGTEFNPYDLPEEMILLGWEK